MKMPLSIYNPYPSALDWDQCASRAICFSHALKDSEKNYPTHQSHTDVSIFFVILYAYQVVCVLNICRAKKTRQPGHVVLYGIIYVRKPAKAEVIRPQQHARTSLIKLTAAAKPMRLAIIMGTMGLRI